MVLFLNSRGTSTFPSSFPATKVLMSEARGSGPQICQARHEPLCVGHRTAEFPFSVGCSCKGARTQNEECLAPMAPHCPPTVHRSQTFTNNSQATPVEGLGTPVNWGQNGPLPPSLLAPLGMRGWRFSRDVEEAGSPNPGCPVPTMQTAAPMGTTWTYQSSGDVRSWLWACRGRANPPPPRKRNRKRRGISEIDLPSGDSSQAR